MNLVPSWEQQQLNISNFVWLFSVWKLKAIQIDLWIEVVAIVLRVDYSEPKCRSNQVKALKNALKEL